MSSIFLLLQTVHDIVHDLPMTSNFSKPKIYTGGADISQWNKLSKQEKEDALSKDWYAYFSFRNPKTGKLERQSNIKAGVNRLKTKEERIDMLEKIQAKIIFLLKQGFNPYQDNSLLEEKLDPKKGIINTPVVIPIEVEEKIQGKVEEEIIIEKEYSIREAFDFGLTIKKNVLSKTSYSGFQGRVNRFIIWLNENGNPTHKISTLTKKTIINYLNHVLENTSASNRNNTRADLSSLVQTLVDNELMKDNFVKNINVLKSAPERNKTYSNTQEIDILKYVKENDPILLLFIQFISYNFLRPVEVCRLKIGDLDLEGKKLFVRAKNKAVKVKIIPQKIIDLLPDFSKMNPDHYLFTPNQIGGEWKTEENNRRDYFSKRFKIIKDHFGLNEDYGLYSFRHTAITNLYKELCKTLTPFEAKSRLMQITGHQTMEALEKYLRDIDAALPDDYSHLLK
ncbi:tyrosine-type recombinase/integrase [Flavobacterium sp.]|jgi:integrase|uniref:tyrosine-type recombinase/integrase n=1 Tax=Flavobacterium sp. TaxID=239 RepID=UPI0037BFAB0A